MSALSSAQRMRGREPAGEEGDRKSTRLNSSHLVISYAVFCLKKKTSPQHHLGDAASHLAADVELPLAAELLELEAQQLGQSFVFVELARNPPSEADPQIPPST